MKKLSWTLLALCFMLTLSACGKSDQKQTDVTPEESVQKTTSERESDDPRESASEGTSEKARETTTAPAENELGFTIESISLNPNDAADTAWEDGIYSLWEALQEVSELKFKGGSNLDALEVDYQAGQEVTATLKSSGRYIKFTKDYIETTFALSFINSADERVLYNQTGEILRVPVSPALVNTSWESLGDYFAFCKWVFSEAACELFHMDVKDGIVTNIYTQS